MSVIMTPLSERIIKDLTDPNGPSLIAVNSGIGSGKSYAIAQGVFVAAQTRPGSLHIVSAGTAGLLMAVLKRRCDEVFGQYAEWRGGLHPRYVFENGSEVDFRAYTMPSTQDEARNGWEGRDCHTLWVDEIEQLPPTALLHTWQRCRLKATDIAGHVQQPTAVWVGRPGAVYHWMEEADVLASRGRRVSTIIMPTSSNRLLSPEYLDNLRASLSRAEFECITQEVPGARMPVKGAIYSDFDDKLNVIDLEVSKTTPTYVCIDFGVTTSAVLWIQELNINGRRASVIVDEWCPDLPTSTRDLVDGIRARGWNLCEAICDPAGDARQRASGLVSEVEIIRRDVDEDRDGLGGGLGCDVCATVPAARRRVRDGIARVQARVCNANGERELYVLRRLWDRPEGKRGVRHSILQYEWDARTGEPRKGKAGHEADHVADALRLYVIRRAWDGAPSASVASPPRTSTPIPPRRHAVSRRAHRAGDRQ